MSIESVELEPLFTLNSPFEKARYFYRLVFREMDLCTSFLTAEEGTKLASYYGNLPNKSEVLRNYFNHRHAQRVQHLIRVASNGARVLDAGCGFGSESILCGILGARVLGVDLIEPWLNTAKKRLKFYEKVLSKSISTEFSAQSVFDVQDYFDVIWSLESISHIDPAEKFISFAHDHLNEGGRLIISDPNRLNPLIYWNARRDARRAGGLHSQMKNPQTGKDVPFAYERIFSVFTIKKLLSENGFAIESLHHSALLPYLPFFNIGHRNLGIHFEKPLHAILPLRWLSGIYTIVGRKV